MDHPDVDDKTFLSVNKLDKIRQIVKREFKTELDVKEQEALAIEDQIIKTKKQLHKLRYAIISSYYKSSSVEVKDHEEKQRSLQANSLVPSGITEFDQRPIHPSLKKLIGKRPVLSLDQLNADRTKRKAAKEAFSALSDSFSKDKPKTLEPKKEDVKTRLSYTPAEQKPAKLTSSRGKNQVKHVLVVGNTSQFINEQSNAMTHKWMCFVKTRSAVPIEKLMKKVQFHLDSSYKPNDVVDVDSPPFQIVRRGYAEFTIKVVVHFKEDVETKPVQIFHPLVLDKKLSGYQSLGSETVTELWTKDTFSDHRTEVKREVTSSVVKSQNFLQDHDYFKTSSSPEFKNIDTLNVNPRENDQVSSASEATNQILKWIDANKNLGSDKNRNSSQVIDVERIGDQSEIDEPLNQDNSDIASEQHFIEAACMDVHVDKSMFDKMSMRILAASLRSFVKTLIGKPLQERWQADEKVISTEDLRKMIRSIPEMDFLTCRIEENQ